MSGHPPCVHRVTEAERGRDPSKVMEGGSWLAFPAVGPSLATPSPGSLAQLLPLWDVRHTQVSPSSLHPQPPNLSGSHTCHSSHHLFSCYCYFFFIF